MRANTNGMDSFGSQPSSQTEFLQIAKRNMGKSSKPIECMQIVKLHEMEGIHNERRKKNHPVVNMTFFPHFAIISNLI